MTLKNYIQSLHISNDQKEHLWSLILEDKKQTQERIIKLVKDSIEFPNSSITDIDQNNYDSSELAIEMKTLDDVIDFADNLSQKVEVIYKRVDINLKKNEIWLDSMSQKIQKTNLQNKKELSKILSEATRRLLSIDKEHDDYWFQYEQKIKEAKKVLDIQMYEMKDEIKQGIKDKGELPDSAEKFIKQVTSLYKKKIEDITREFTSQLDDTSKKIESLTDETQDQIKDIVQDSKISDLRDQIMGV